MSHWQLIILFCHPHFGMPGQRIVVLFRYPLLRMFRPIYPFRVLRRLVTGHKPGNCPSYSDPSPGYAPPAIRSCLIVGHENRTSDPWADLDSEEKSMRAIKSILDIVLVAVTFYILVLCQWDKWSVCVNLLIQFWWIVFRDSFGSSAAHCCPLSYCTKEVSTMVMDGLKRIRNCFAVNNIMILFFSFKVNC